MIRSLIPLSWLLAAVFTTAAFAQPPIPTESESMNQAEDGSGPRSPLKLTVKTDKTVFHAGETVHITLFLKNPTKSAVPVTFASGQKYDVFILRPPVDKKPAEIVWQWSLGMMFTQMVTTTTYPPGKTAQFEVKYPPDDGTKPAPLTKGAYTIKATITTMGNGRKPEAGAKFKVK